MSTAEYQQGEQHSSVAISENSKGEPSVTVKVYSHDLDTLDAAREKAVEVYKQARQAVRS